MAFDETLASRVRKRLGKRAGLSEKQMFGGIAFLLDGNMCVGVHGDELIVRLPPDDTDAALARPHTHPFDLMGRPMKSLMKGWILVKPKGLATEAALGKWVAMGTKYAASLPPK